MTLENHKIIEKNSNLSHKFQQLTSYIRSRGLEEVREVVGEGSWSKFKSSIELIWLSNMYVNNIYEYYSSYMHTHFRHPHEPKRCREALIYFTDELYNRLKVTRKRLSKSKVKTTVRFFIKHVSRMKFFSHVGLKYSRNESYYQDYSQVSYTFLMEFIDFLSEKDYIINCVGYRDSSTDKNIKSLVIPSQRLVDFCIGGGKLPTIMDDCLKRSYDLSYILRERQEDKDGKIIKVERRLKRGENKVAKGITESIVAFNKHIDKYYICINDVYIPEAFFYRTFIQDFYHGGRLSCAEIQNRPKSERLTITIDREQTVSLDFWAMHFCIAAELEGWDIGDHDPYSTDVSLYVNWWEVLQHEQYFGLSGYNPIRNICKTGVLTCLNAPNRLSGVKGLSNALFKDSKRKQEISKKFVGLCANGKISRLIDSLIEHNKKIEKYFNSDFGIKAQYYESQIAQFCVDVFREHDKVCIPVHDSLTVTISDIEFGMYVMEQAYKHVLGSNKNCRISIETL